ncbi:MAG: carboxypeptidase regulatory-like domain-containing protein [Candidatus Eisenbacteria bacterium]|nr:carboxypeptidase regulatory-like domain-containing protein [Candidatus Eisenbacteria bacterium]
METRFSSRVLVRHGDLLALAFLALSLAVSVAGTQPEDWMIECADCPKRFGKMTDRCLCLDTSGFPHIAYGHDHLYYAWFDGAFWHHETVDTSPGVGMFTSMAMDSMGFPHISYFDLTNGDLKYASQDGNGWQIQTVDAQDSVGTYASMALDGNGFPHISYRDDTSLDIKYASWNGSEWEIQIIDSDDRIDRYSTLELDAAGFPHIGYLYDNPSPQNDELTYAYLDGTGWHFETVDSTLWNSLHLSIALGSTGAPRISYNSDGNLRYACSTDSGWQVQTVDSEGDVGGSSSLVLDGTESPHISYFVYYPDFDVRYAYLDGSVWQIETVESTGSVGWATSLALDDAGQAHVSYLEVWSKDLLKYARRDESGWHAQIIDEEGSVGEYSSLALDVLGLPHISYFDREDGDLKYVTRDATGWQAVTVDVEGDAGLSTALMLDNMGFAHIGYVGAGSVKHASWDGSVWRIQTVASESPATESVSLALDDGGFPHVSLMNEYPARVLKYAHRDETGWYVEAVDGIGASGGAARGTSIALDETDSPQIAYFQMVSKNLIHASRSGAGWQIHVVDSEGEVGMYPSMELDGDNHPHISYYGNGALKYAYWNGSAWSIQNVDSEAGATPHPTRCTSLALDPLGFPHISYHDAVNDDLKYAYWDGSAWQIRTVDSEGKVGGYSSLALDGMGFPHMSYYHATNCDLKYARGAAQGNVTLVGQIVGNDLVLCWNPVIGTEQYWVYGASNDPFFTPGDAPGFEHRMAVLPAITTTWSSPVGVGDPTANRTYLISVVDDIETEIARSNRFGEYDFEANLSYGARE